MKARIKALLLGALIAAGGGLAGAAAPERPAPSAAGPECCSAAAIHVAIAGQKQPALGAWVRLRVLDGTRATQWDGRTDIDGMAYFNTLPPGVYIATAKHKGMTTSGWFRLEPCGLATLSLVLAAPDTE